MSRISDDPTRVYSPDEELLIPKAATEKPVGELKAFPIDKWKALRQKARTNAEFLAVEILGYRDFDPAHVYAHYAFLCAMQPFKGGTDTLDNITLEKGAGYVPACKMWDLEYHKPQRLALILASRGFLKSSCFTVLHSIQWIINYPAVRILLSSGTGAQVSRFISIIVQHFRYNEQFRWLFPEFVPHGKEVKQFGSTEAMTIRQSIRKEVLGEPTISTISVGMVISGPHQDVHFHDDVVDKENVRTPVGLDQVTSHLQHTAPLLERREGKPGWKFLIGTRYHYADPYGLIIDEERKKAKGERQYVIVFAPAWNGRWNTVDCKATWPVRLPLSELKAIESDPLQGPDILATQYGLRPRPGKSGLVEDESQIVYVSRQILSPEFVKTLRIHTTVDLHGFARGQQNISSRKENDFTCVNTSGFAGDGHCYVLRMLHDRPTPFEVIEYLFQVYFDFPNMVDIKIPKDMLGHQLMFWLQREQMRRQHFLPIVPMDIDNQISKEQKNRALQPWFKARLISFADDLPCKQAIKDEIMRFPKYHDDILDTIRDQMENRNATAEASSMQVVLPPAPQLPRNLGAPRRFIGFEQGTGRELWSVRDEDAVESGIDPITGV